MNMNALAGSFETGGEDQAPAAARRKVESTLRNILPNDVHYEFPPGTKLRIAAAHAHAYEGVVGDSGRGTGYLEFEMRNEPDRNPLHETPIAELYEVDEPTYQEHLSRQSGRKRDIHKYGRSTLYIAYDAAENEYLIERLAEDKLLDEQKD